jgi:hypothetical protein
MKKIILIAFLFPLIFSSCENSDTLTDDELIQAIIDSDNRTTISKNDLPKSAISTLNVEMPNDVINIAVLAPELGYEVEMKSWDFFDFELDYERNDNQFFSTNGRPLESSKNKNDGWGDKKRKDGKDDKKKRGPCFKFQYPLSYTMGDGSIITGNDRKEIHSKMKTYFGKNEKTKENRPKLNFPVTILMLDGDKNEVSKEIESHDILKKVMSSCKGSKGDKESGDDRKG